MCLCKSRLLQREPVNSSSSFCHTSLEKAKRAVDFTWKSPTKQRQENFDLYSYGKNVSLKSYWKDQTCHCWTSSAYADFVLTYTLPLTSEEIKVLHFTITQNQEPFGSCWNLTGLKIAIITINVKCESQRNLR